MRNSTDAGAVPDATASDSNIPASPSSSQSSLLVAASSIAPSIRTSTEENRGKQTPPPYAPSSLRCITPQSNTRYGKRPLAFENQPRHLQIPGGMPAYLDSGVAPAPEGWTQLHHPEGPSYWYHRDESVVTEANMGDPMTCVMVSQWICQIAILVEIYGIVLQPSIELVLQPDEDNETCGYYFVDHVSRTIFWIETTTTIDQDIAPVTSVSHLKLALTQNYYTHVEYFCMHIKLPESVRNELVAILSHACVGENASREACSM
ncbi:hypothetical protein SISSUDRAFT_1037809 [Sistotremastrum suecicum HHB10207 ss-3]|uniref:WW domain-containing protein n=1 Tax=Sistotremastrum suecicum HHB10207 ss-3 TaxID=1314776 RepID=A0A165XMG9_9AGAM|nr:hypothetical protein SISSUDRAFT_1037809 [Sistotremastrum suecicum HHB10207 ss-3]